ncbi:MAG: iron-sulfur cluster assembly accessory protein [Hyphomicrobium sp.]|uniref:HesB/IscA family protein n=1 Tax=Hyphomicrobium sp. TaxID=82 RepID=UPI00132634A5|nr:iron-sulfur cluster assembly accessory protein [Hyphomicrobium sp.]KAB2944012.1 MAG: iron-sulfur cluster assembly accessory protein [Hyphomicrobium sp.]MBZ0209304.1 iron-sulfur cluster assembly accessory protein [Hyphomicrobium sp.]
MNMSVTPAAQKFIQRMLRFDGVPGSGFRMEVSAGGCSGLAAQFSVEGQPRPGDATVTLGGVKFFLPAESRLLLDGVTIDFVDSPLQSGFVFHDPKATSCGCSNEAKPTVDASVLKLS